MFTSVPFPHGSSRESAYIVARRLSPRTALVKELRGSSADERGLEDHVLVG
jgi:hypothetical protein